MDVQYQIQAMLNPVPNVLIPAFFASGSAEWGKLQPQCFIAPDIIVIPPDQFDLSKKVPDERRWRYESGKPLRRIQPGEAPLDVVVALILESPHLHEYTPAFKPIGPLMNPRSQTRVVRYLPDMLDDHTSLAAALRKPGFRLPAADIVLVNPIPYQASLVRLWKPEYQNRMLSAVRNSMWRAIWNAIYQGRSVYQEDFLARLATFGPTLVINACTAGLKDDVTQLLRQRTRYPVVGASKHPSYWGSRTRLIPV